MRNLIFVINIKHIINCLCLLLYLKVIILQFQFIFMLSHIFYIFFYLLFFFLEGITVKLSWIYYIMHISTYIIYYVLYTYLY